MNKYFLWLLAYSLALIGLGVYFSRRVRRASDFLVAGRRLGPVLVFSTFLAANIGAGSTVGAAGLGYSLGWSAWWWVGSAGLGCIVLAATVGPRIWALAKSHDFQTLGDFLQWRYSRAVRGCVAAILWIGTLFLLAAQLDAISIVLSVVAGLPRWQGAVLGGLVVISYFVAGGLLSSAWVNLVELAVLLAGFVLAVPFALDSAGGWGEVANRISTRGLTMPAADYFNPFGVGIGKVLYYVALLAPSFIVSPGLVQKIYGARSESAVRAGVLANGIALLVFAAIPPCLGIIAASQLPPLRAGEEALALPKVMTGLLPSWLGILGLAAIFSAEVSTCDAVLLMLSSSLTVDFYKSFVNRSVSEASLLRASRISASIAGILGVAVAIEIPSIVSSLTFFYSLVSVALFVPVVAGLYWSRPDARAALGAILTSVPCTLLIYFLAGEVVLGFMNPFIIGIGVSGVVLWFLTVAGPKSNRKPEVAAEIARISL